MCSYSYTLKNIDLDFKNRETPPAKPYIKEPSILELKDLPYLLCYAFVGANNAIPVIIVAYFMDCLVEALISILLKFKRVVGWSITNIIGIPLTIHTHKI